MLDIQETAELPRVRRGGGRPSAEKQQIIEALKGGKVNVIRDVEAGNKYNALQQRIRQAAASANLKVKIVFTKHEDNPEIGDLHFEGHTDEPVEVVEDEPKAVAPKANRSRTAAK